MSAEEMKNKSEGQNQEPEYRALACLFYNEDFSTMREQADRIQASFDVMHWQEKHPVQQMCRMMVKAGEDIYPATDLAERVAKGSYLAFDEVAWKMLTDAQRNAIQTIYGAVCGYTIYVCDGKSEPNDLVWVTIRKNDILDEFLAEYVLRTVRVNGADAMPFAWMKTIPADWGFGAKKKGTDSTAE